MAVSETIPSSHFSGNVHVSRIGCMNLASDWPWSSNAQNSRSD